MSDGAFVPLLNSCVEECHVRKLCALKGIVTTDMPSSFKKEDVRKEEPKEEPEEEPNDESTDSDVDERMAEADADIEADVWRSTLDTDHGNNNEESECASRPQQYEQLETAKTEKSGGGVNGSSGGGSGWKDSGGGAGGSELKAVQKELAAKTAALSDQVHFFDQFNRLVNRFIHQFLPAVAGLQ